eukprot:gene5926-11957_t
MFVARTNFGIFFSIFCAVDTNTEIAQFDFNEVETESSTWKEAFTTTPMPRTNLLQNSMQSSRSSDCCDTNKFAVGIDCDHKCFNTDIFGEHLLNPDNEVSSTTNQNKGVETVIAFNESEVQSHIKVEMNTSVADMEIMVPLWSLPFFTSTSQNILDVNPRINRCYNCHDSNRGAAASPSQRYIQNILEGYDLVISPSDEKMKMVIAVHNKSSVATGGSEEARRQGSISLGMALEDELKLVCIDLTPGIAISSEDAASFEIQQRTALDDLLKAYHAIAPEAIEDEDQALLSHAHNSYGVSLFFQRKWEEAHQHFSKALSLCDHLTGVNVAHIHSNLGAIHYQESSFADAKVHYEKALLIYENSTHTAASASVLFAQARCLSSLGTTLRAMKKLFSSREKYQQALTLFSSIYYDQEDEHIVRLKALILDLEEDPAISTFLSADRRHLGIIALQLSGEDLLAPDLFDNLGLNESVSDGTTTLTKSASAVDLVYIVNMSSMNGNNGSTDNHNHHMLSVEVIGKLQRAGVAVAMPLQDTMTIKTLTSSYPTSPSLSFPPNVVSVVSLSDAISMRTQLAAARDSLQVIGVKVCGAESVDALDWLTRPSIHVVFILMDICEPMGMGLVHESKRLHSWLEQKQVTVPVVHTLRMDGSDKTQFFLRAGAEVGALLVEGLGDGVLLHQPSLTVVTLRKAANNLLLSSGRRNLTSIRKSSDTAIQVRVNIKELKKPSALHKTLQLNKMGPLQDGKDAETKAKSHMEEESVDKARLLEDSKEKARLEVAAKKKARIDADATKKARIEAESKEKARLLEDSKEKARLEVAAKKKA